MQVPAETDGALLVAGARVAVDAPAAGVGATTTTGDGRGDNEIFIDAEILTANDCQSSGDPDEDFVRVIKERDLIFSNI
jgi:hypothetical protein